MHNVCFYQTKFIYSLFFLNLLQEIVRQKNLYTSFLDTKATKKILKFLLSRRKKIIRECGRQDMFVSHTRYVMKICGRVECQNVSLSY